MRPLKKTLIWTPPPPAKSQFLITDFPHSIVHCDPDHIPLDAFRITVALELSKAFPGVDLGNFTVALPRFRLQAKLPDLITKAKTARAPDAFDRSTRARRTAHARLLYFYARTTRPPRPQ